MIHISKVALQGVVGTAENMLRSLTEATSAVGGVVEANTKHEVGVSTKARAKTVQQDPLGTRKITTQRGKGRSRTEDTKLDLVRAVPPPISPSAGRPGRRRRDTAGSN